MNKYFTNLMTCFIALLVSFIIGIVSFFTIVGIAFMLFIASLFGKTKVTLNGKELK